MQGNDLKAADDSSSVFSHFYVHRDQPGNCSEPSGYSQHTAVPPDA